MPAAFQFDIILNDQVNSIVPLVVTLFKRSIIFQGLDYCIYKAKML